MTPDEFKSALNAHAKWLTRWDNCPMAEAFDVHDIRDVPESFRPGVAQFIKFFDAGLLTESPTATKTGEGCGAGSK